MIFICHTLLFIPGMDMLQFLQYVEYVLIPSLETDLAEETPSGHFLAEPPHNRPK